MKWKQEPESIKTLRKEDRTGGVFLGCEPKDHQSPQRGPATKLMLPFLCHGWWKLKIDVWDVTAISHTTGLGKKPTLFDVAAQSNPTLLLWAAIYMDSNQQRAANVYRDSVVSRLTSMSWAESEPVQINLFFSAAHYYYWLFKWLVQKIFFFKPR